MENTAPAAPVASSAPATPAPEAPKAEATPAVTPTPAAPVGETVAEKKARLLKLKIDGAEEEVNLDELPDDKLAADLQMARAARKRMNEAAEERKRITEERANIEEALRFLKENPRDAFKRMGHDFDEIASQYFAAQIQEQQKLSGLSEAEREVLKLKQELASRDEMTKAEQARKEAELQQAEQARLDAEIAERITKDFDEAAKMLDLGEGRDPFVYGIMADIANVPGVELTPQQLVAETRERMNYIHRTFTAKLDGTALLNHLGPDTVKKVLRASAAKVKSAKAPAPAPAAPVVNNLKQDQDKPEEFLSLADFRKTLR